MNETAATPAEPPDAALVGQALRGDDQAFLVLVRRYQAPVFACTRAITGHEADAKDAAQETFIRFHRHLAQFDPQRPLRPYLLRIAANCSRSLLASRAHEPAGGSDEELATVADPAALPGAGLAHRERQVAVRELINGLPQTLREVCSLFYLSNQPCREVAAMLQMNETAVKVALHRARRKLQHALAEWRAV